VSFRKESILPNKHRAYAFFPKAHNHLVLSSTLAAAAAAAQPPELEVIQLRDADGKIPVEIIASITGDTPHGSLLLSLTSSPPKPSAIGGDSYADCPTANRISSALTFRASDLVARKNSTCKKNYC
jgi:hypothetical protein